MTKTYKEAYVVTPVSDSFISPLKCIPYIHYLVWFKKDQVEVQVLINSDNKINAMTTAYAAKLGFRVRLTDIGAQKIDDSTLETFGMVLASF